MEDSNKTLEKDKKVHTKHSQSNSISFQWKKYANHYQNIKASSHPQFQNWIQAISSLKKENERQRSPRTLNFLLNVKENDSEYRLEHKEYLAIFKEIVEMFQMRIKRILEDKESIYYSISEENRRLFKNINRLNDTTLVFCHPEKLIKYDLVGLFIQKNYEYQQCAFYPIKRFHSTKTIEDLIKFQVLSNMYISYRIKWEQSYHFLDHQRTDKYFIMLIDLITLVIFKRKVSSKSKGSTFEQKDLKPFKSNKPKKRLNFIKCEKFKYRFCELVMIQPSGTLIGSRGHIIKSEITNKTLRILERSQYTDQRYELRQLMIQHYLTFKSLAEWMESLQGEQSILLKQKKIYQELEKYKWNFQKADSLQNTLQIQAKTRIDTKNLLSSQNYVGEYLCKIALERFRTYATILKVQNFLMREIDSQTPLYIRRFEYSYQKYFYMHHKDSSGSTESPQKAKKKENTYTIAYGFYKDKNAFTFKFDEEINQYYYIQHLVAFFKEQKRVSYNIVLSELDFGQNSLLEASFKRIIGYFMKNFQSFVKFEASPLQYFYHFLAHEYVHKCLSETPFESKQQFSQLLSKSVLRIISIINSKKEAQTYPKQSNSCQSMANLSVQQQPQRTFCNFDKIAKEEISYLTKYSQEFDSFQISKKVHNLLAKDQLLQIRWHGKSKFCKKGVQCEYYINGQQKSQDKRQLFKEYEPFWEDTSPQSFSLKEKEDLSASLLMTFKKYWPFLTNSEIKDQISNIAEFRKEKNTSVFEIRSFFKGIARILLIYQAYFNEYFLSEKARPQILKEHQKSIKLLRAFYDNETENINKVCPQDIRTYYLRLLHDISLFPATLAKFSHYSPAEPRYRPIEEQQREMENYIEPFQHLE